MYIYESHLGGLYVSEMEYPHDYLYCETCGDADWFVGRAETKKEARKIIKGLCYEPKYIKKFLDETFAEAENEIKHTQKNDI